MNVLRELTALFLLLLDESSDHGDVHVKNGAELFAADHFIES